MFMNPSKMIFLMLMILSTIIIMSSNTWLSAWMGLEMNLLSFIPLMNNNKNLLTTESSMKYFLIQVMSSSILLFMIIMFMLNFNLNYLLMNKIINLIIILSLMMKLGMPPFHYWFPNMIEGLNWINLFILFTWQKIAPFILISNMLTLYIIPMIILSLIIGSIGGLNHLSLKKILTYSSINHLSWMMMSMLYNKFLWVNYFMIYFIILIPLIYYFNMNKLFYINQLYFTFNYKIKSKMIFFMNFMSLSGLPPFLGFYPKWILIELISKNHMLMSMIMMMITLITLFYYIRITYSKMMILYYENNWNQINNINNMLYMWMSYISICGFTMINMFYSLF